jgi:hypothetical protein
MGEYVGLDGVRGGRLKPRGKHIASTVSGFMEILRKKRVCSGAGDDGSATVWRTDKGTYRCEFSRYLSSINSAEFAMKSDVRCWLKEWLPKMERQ